MSDQDSNRANSVANTDEEANNNAQSTTFPSLNSDEHTTQSSSTQDQSGANLEDGQVDEDGQDVTGQRENAGLLPNSDEVETQDEYQPGPEMENRLVDDDENDDSMDAGAPAEVEEYELMPEDEEEDEISEDEVDQIIDEEEEMIAQDEERHPRRFWRWPHIRHYLRRIAHHFVSSDDEEMAVEQHEEANENIARPQNITFDKSLPTSHTYLGEMDDCSGIPYIEQETFIVLPILQVPSFVLVPGQSMPLNISFPRHISLMQAVMSREDKTFGVVLLKNHYYSAESPEKLDIGCTAELRSMRQEEVDEITMMVGIAVGRQRFKVMEERREVDGNITAKVRILRDDDLPPPAFAARLGIHHKLHLLPEKHWRKTSRLRHRNQVKAAWLTRWPPWVHNMYDVRRLREQLLMELKEWNKDLDERSLPTSATELSYWVASRLPMATAMRLRLLAMDNSILRLRFELNLLRKCTIYECKVCKEEITNKRDVFSMSHSGPMAAYVNPSGHIHETLTVYRSKNIVHTTRPTTEHSWFPGYAWSICECSQCRRHLGWRFTATKSDLYPRKFWGLTRSALSLRMNQEETKSSANESGSLNSPMSRNSETTLMSL